MSQEQKCDLVVFSSLDESQLHVSHGSSDTYVTVSGADEVMIETYDDGLRQTVCTLSVERLVALLESRGWTCQKKESE